MKWILLAAAILLFALVFNTPLLAYAVGMGAAIFFLSRVWTARWSGQIKGRRECQQEQARIGDRVPVHVEIENQGRWTIPWVLAEDLLPIHTLNDLRPRLVVHGARVAVAKLKPGSNLSLGYELECRTRGYYQVGPTVCETGDFFGLQRRFRVIGEPNYLLVWPKIIPLEGYDIQSRRPIGEVVMSHRLFEDPTRISGIRQYQPGDPLTRVHWRATARTGTLQSKQYQASSMSGATLVLDFHRDAFDPNHEPFRSELAVTAAASIAHALHEMGQQFGLVSNAVDAADRIRQHGWTGDWRTREESRAEVSMHSSSDRRRPLVVSTSQANDQITRVLETLARVELGTGLLLEELLVESSERLPADATVLVLVSQIQLPTAVALGLLRRRGYAVTAIVNSHNPESFLRTQGLLAEQGIAAAHLRDEESIRWICQQQMLAGR